MTNEQKILKNQQTLAGGMTTIAKNQVSIQNNIAKWFVLSVLANALITWVIISIQITGA
jgi:hypothetical protein